MVLHTGCFFTLDEYCRLVFRWQLGKFGTPISGQITHVLQSDNNSNNNTLFKVPHLIGLRTWGHLHRPIDADIHHILKKLAQTDTHRHTHTHTHTCCIHTNTYNAHYKLHALLFSRDRLVKKRRKKQQIKSQPQPILRWHN